MAFLAAPAVAMVDDLAGIWPIGVVVMVSAVLASCMAFRCNGHFLD